MNQFIVKFNPSTEPRVATFVENIKKEGGNLSESIKSLIRRESLNKELEKKMG